MRKENKVIQKPKPLELKPRTYQPGKAEREEKHDMPELSVKQAREVFMRPFQFVQKG